MPATGSSATGSFFRLTLGLAGLVLLVVGAIVLVALLAGLYVALAAAVVPFLILLGLTRLLYWLVTRLAAYGFPERAGPWHRWPRSAIWLVAIGASAVVAWAAVSSAKPWAIYAGAVTTPVGKVLSPVPGLDPGEVVRQIRAWVDFVVMTSGRGWREPLLWLALLAAWKVQRGREAEARRVATIDARPARKL
jgi:hypothetical protein